MPRYSEELLEEIRQKNDIVDLISGYVNLKKKGRDYFGLCPFHSERTGSFSVSPSKQMYYCFGCHASGSVYTFMQKHESMSFPEAVQFLADKAGVKLPEIKETEEMVRARSRRERLYDINEAAAEYYFCCLRAPGGELGLRYFEKRELDRETMNRFGLGYASQDSSRLVAYLKQKGFTADEMRAAGLASFSEKYGLHDFFFNRVIFPIMNGSGKVISFGGRVMGDGEPKYLNTQETEIFEKGKNLYGLHIARGSRAKNFILCEGYMDVISLHQAGFTQAMASLGTAFTIHHANILRRMNREILLSYDNDGAGRMAAIRALQMLRRVGIRARVIDMQPYKDPDEFIKNLGTEEYEKRIENAENGFLFEIRTIRSDYDTSDPGGKTEFEREIARRLCSFEEEIERNNYLETIAEEYGIPKDVLRRQVIAEAEKSVRTDPETEEQEFVPRPGETRRSEDQRKYAQRVLLTWLSEEPKRYGTIRGIITAEDFTDPVYHRIAERLFRDMEEGPPNPAAILNMFEDADEQEEAAAVFHTRLAAIVTDEEKEKAFRDVVVRIKEERLEHDQNLSGEEKIPLKAILEQKRILEDLRKQSRL
ncbi:MAG: DNA primase [Lachnospiraceae bacterium]|nr:DNA primase [Lachnospiraceae bacterium]